LATLGETTLRLSALHTMTAELGQLDLFARHLLAPFKGAATKR